MSYRYPSPPYDLIRQGKWRKEKALAWFHEVTSVMNESEIVLECIKRNIATHDRTLREMQTDLLQCDGDVK